MFAQYVHGHLSIAGVPNLSLTMYPFSLPTDEYVPLKFLMTKYFIVINHRYIKKQAHNGF